jgi:hypothetical protein
MSLPARFWLCYNIDVNENHLQLASQGQADVSQAQKASPPP